MTLMLIIVTVSNIVSRYLFGGLGYNQRSDAFNSAIIKAFNEFFIIYVIESKSGKQLWLSYLIPKFLYDGKEHDNGDDGCNDGNVENVYLVSFLHDNESFF